jgi:hypothetical protein
MVIVPWLYIQIVTRVILEREIWNKVVWLGDGCVKGEKVDYIRKVSEPRLSVLMAVFCHNPHVPPELLSPKGSN